MKWDYDLETLRELGAKGDAVQGDVIEALRAIAEQLERLASGTDPTAVEVGARIKLALEHSERHLRSLDDR